MKRRRQLKAATMMQIGIAGVLLILLVLFLVWYSDGLNSFKPEEATYLYIAGVKVAQTEKAVFRNKEGKVDIADVDGTNQVIGTPILYEGEPKVTLSCNMLLMVPSESKGVERVNYFTTITENSGLSTLTYNGENVKVRGGFLYDGEDTYIVLEQTTLLVGGKEVELGPLSYVTVAYQQYAEYHNSLTNEHETINTSGVEVVGKVVSGYTIDFGKDAIDTGDGEALLFSAVDSVPLIEMGK